MDCSTELQADRSNQVRTVGGHPEIDGALADPVVQAGHRIVDVPVEILNSWMIDRQIGQVLLGGVERKQRDTKEAHAAE